MRTPASIALCLALWPACRSSAPATSQRSASPTPPAPPASTVHNAPELPPIVVPAVEMGQPTQAMPETPAGLSAATFAGGCFWCLEYAFEHVTGVRDAVSGYTGGPEEHPTYSQVSGHATAQAESVRVFYDPRVVTYEQLLEVYWHRIDPIHRDQSFVDQGPQYRSVIFVQNPLERAAALNSLHAITASGSFNQPIVTTLEDLPAVYWVAEAYHQNYWRTHPEEFARYHDNSGRREFLRAHWGPEAPY